MSSVQLSLENLDSRIPYRFAESVLSAASNVVFTDLPAGNIRIEISDLTISADNYLHLEVSSDNGVGYKSTLHEYSVVSKETQSNTRNIDDTNAGTAALIRLTSNTAAAWHLDSATTGSAWLTIEVNNLDSSARHKHFDWKGRYSKGDDGAPVKVSGHGSWIGTDVLNALRIGPPSGTISGTVRVFIDP
jgi:hypothetical protein